MKKNDLIKKLQQIEGNPEIVLWNGMVGDWMPIGNLSEAYLTKITKQYWLESVSRDHAINNRNWDYKIPEEDTPTLEKQYRKFQWESNDFVTSEDIKKKRYKKKRIIYIDAKVRGVTTFDRIGSLKY